MNTNSAAKRFYRGAVALSNIGVSFLERHQIGNGLEALKDAVIICKMAFQNGDMKDSPLPNVSMEAKVDQACRRMALSSRIGPVDYLGNITVHVIAHGADFASIESVLQNQQFGNSCVFPIRLECHEFEEYNLDIVSAMILHNLATAHLLLSRIAHNGKDIRSLEKSVYKLSTCAYSVLENILANKNDAMEMIDGDDELLVYFLSLVIMQTRCLLLLGTGHICEAAHTFQHMLQIESEVADTVGVLMHFMPAAAA